MVDGCQHSSIGAGHLALMRLGRGQVGVVLARSGHFRRVRTSIDSPGATVEADVADMHVVNARVVRVVDDVDVYVGHGAVIEEMAAGPIAAEEAGAWIAEAIVDAAVEADMRPPIAGIPDIEAVIPAPIAGSPEKADNGRLNPRAGNPIIAVITVGPITRSPDVA